ncbi:MAG: M23 family metallopeptidase [Deltaproteobacteria bacterium]|nr:MAG: M23 family metallopeptidase [Deltaproteobacteria bacterium]
MTMIARIALWWVPLFFLLGLPCYGGGLVTISWSPTELRQGEVLSVVVKSETKIASVRGDLDGTPIFFHEREGGSLGGIAGVDLGVSPGPHPLRVSGEDPGGRPFKSVFQVKVRKGEFRVQRLTLPREMVELKEEVLRRVQEENRKVKKILLGIRREKFWHNYFVKPVDGSITGAFGLRRIINDQPRSPHSGVDISASLGSPVRSCNGGIVVLAQELYFGGKTIIIDHGLALYSIYMHLAEMRVRKGEEVKGGDVIGLVGATGRATGPHLHWGIRLMGARIDPLSLLRLFSSGE